MHYFAGLDIGTTNTKLLICKPSLEIVFQKKLGYAIGFGATLDATEIYQNVQTLLDQANELLDFSSNLLTISISAAMHSLVLVDESCNPLTPVYTWADTSSQPIMSKLAAESEAQSLFPETGTPLHPMSPFCKMVWMQSTTPELLKSAFKCIGIKELLWFRFTGTWEIDYSIASATGLFSQKTQRWHPEALKLAGIRVEQLAEPVMVTRTIEKGNIHWVIGASDGCLAQLGSGAMEKGTAALTIGTSGAIRINLPELWIDPKLELFTYMLDETHFICGGSTNNGGIVLEWWHEKVMEKGDNLANAVQGFGEAVAKAVPGCDGLVCLPYFGGERAPVWNAAARGIFSGIHNGHGQLEFKRAILEGIGFSFRRLLEKLEFAGGKIDVIYASGGFSKNNWWVQLMADILQKPILVNAKDVDASSLGAIALGLKSEQLISDWKQFSELLPRQFTSYTPAITSLEIYESNYQHYCRLCQY